MYKVIIDSIFVSGVGNFYKGQEIDPKKIPDRKILPILTSEGKIQKISDIQKDKKKYKSKEKFRTMVDHDDASTDDDVTDETAGDLLG